MTIEQHEHLVELVKKLVMGTTPFISALEGGWDINLEDLHEELREAVGISREEWEESEAR